MAKKPKTSSGEKAVKPKEVERLVIWGQKTYGLRQQIMDLGGLWDDVRLAWVVKLTDTVRYDKIEKEIATLKAKGCLVETVYRHKGT